MIRAAWFPPMNKGTEKNQNTVMMIGGLSPMSGTLNGLPHVSSVSIATMMTVPIDKVPKELLPFTPRRAAACKRMARNH